MSGHILSYLITAETRRAHRAAWFVWSGGQKIRHTARMRGHWPGWDVTCSCGWQSRTGGATRASVEDMLWDHRFSEQCAQDRAAGQEVPG